ncbi:reverse transcriptase zinc-binding domain-containing protein [Artemisia annua]|uniref:Reverse transcriptase zinc-binding domain-containing protein n=1 Tax=Artemisia annua TaxID=35608 RepID=A0A2U1MHU2_ARTAN|nr:reverse transcriptase zinc-binding domain-containing protein [Artemisia annua]
MSHSVFVRKVGDGSLINFWEDAWYGMVDFKTLFPRLYSPETFKWCKVKDRCKIFNGSFSRTWAWRRQIRSGPEIDQFNSLNALLCDFAPTNSPDTWECSLDSSKAIRWNKMLPIKINIHSWRLGKDRLPARCNLDANGIDLDSTCCPLCDQAIEDLQRLFVESTCRWGMFAGEASTGIVSPSIIPGDDVGPTLFSVKEAVPRWHGLPQRHVAGEYSG